MARRVGPMYKAAFLINPVAGCGQFLNLKGSDTLTPSTCPRFISLEKGIEFLNEVKDLDVTFVTASGSMGESAFKSAGVGNYKVIYSYVGECQASDTIEFVRKLRETDADILVFFGGDGTARNIVDAECHIPVLGVPLGTKMFSSVFAISFQRAVQVFRDLASGKEMSFSGAEVIDLDEASYAEGKISISAHGEMTVPQSEMILSESKAEYPATSVSGIAEYIVEKMEENTNYITGPGSTCKSVNEMLGAGGSLLGFDLLRNGKLVKADLSENEIFSAADNRTILVLSPVGGQGFLIGRGNKQLTSRVIEKIGFGNILIISSEEKLRQIPGLYVDINGFKGTLPGYVKVLFSYGRYKMLRLLS